MAVAQQRQRRRGEATTDVARTVGCGLSTQCGHAGRAGNCEPVQVRGDALIVTAQQA